MEVWRLSFFFQAEDGIRDLVRSRGLGDVYKRQSQDPNRSMKDRERTMMRLIAKMPTLAAISFKNNFCLLYTSDAADERSSVDLGGRRIIKKKKTNQPHRQQTIQIQWLDEP